MPALASATSDSQEQDENEFCFMCHGEKGAKNEAGASIYVESESFAASVHGKNGITCVSCHPDAESEDGTHEPILEAVDCGGCHMDEAEAYANSVHDLSNRNGDSDYHKYEAAGCADCHGKHDILPVKDRASRVYPLNVPNTCARCHADEKLIAKYKLPALMSVKAYLGSIHGQGVTKQGLVVSAACNDCHHGHDILPAADPASSISRANVPATCATCHEGVYQHFAKGVHGKFFLEGNEDVPICTDCHGEHDIFSHLDTRSHVSALKSAETCARCHDSVPMSEKYHMPPARMETYATTYHGVASRLGDTTVANCASCHGYHLILPSEDPQSSVNPANLEATCGGCHPGVGPGFGKGKVHTPRSLESHWIARLVKYAYILLISGTLGFFVLYIGIDLLGIWRRRRRGES